MRMPIRSVIIWPAWKLPKSVQHVPTAMEGMLSLISTCSLHKGFRVPVAFLPNPKVMTQRISDLKGPISCCLKPVANSPIRAPKFNPDMKVRSLKPRRRQYLLRSNSLEIRPQSKSSRPFGRLLRIILSAINLKYCQNVPALMASRSRETNQH